MALCQAVATSSCSLLQIYSLRSVFTGKGLSCKERSSKRRTLRSAGQLLVRAEAEDNEGKWSDGKNGGFTSSWGAKDSQGKDYLYRLGKEADSVNVTVGAKSGVIDDLFVGQFLGKDADIVFKYRNKITRSFQYLDGDYYIAPTFLDKVVMFMVKNYLTEQITAKVPLILGIWGGKGQGKTFQVELIFKAMDVEPVVMSAGELESEWAGEPGRLIRDRYRTAAAVVKTKGKMSCLVINDLDAGVGRHGNTQMTVNNQIVMGTLMSLCDDPHQVSVGQEWRVVDHLPRVPIIVTGNDFSTLYAPLIRDGRMEKFYWQPSRDDLIHIVQRMYEKDGLTMDDIATIIDTFPNQALDFYGAMRSRTYDDKIREWIQGIGGELKMQEKLMKLKKGEEPPTVDVPKQSVEGLIAAGHELAAEQQKVNDIRLSDIYLKKGKKGEGGGLSFG